ncbi:MAG: dihydroorotate dehydrogenase electron transfer subunit [Treponema sp.]|nr:dihydroorotate dehydrogenase electron transfer subunit [Treponema sp.]
MTDKINNNCGQSKEYLLCECRNRFMLNEEIAVLEIMWTGPAPKSGQFFLLRPQRTSVFLGRPISTASWQPVGAGGILKFIFAIRGSGTRELACVKPGEKIFLTGPLGNGWADAAVNAVIKPRTVPGSPALICGGVGIPPLAFFASELQPGSFDFYAGFRGKPFGLEQIQARKTVVSSEDGSAGFRGLITDHFSPESYGSVYACGPEPMLLAVAAKCRALDVQCFVSLERRMACGSGACLGCTVKTRSGNKRCCADGPVFDAKEIFLDE